MRWILLSVAATAISAPSEEYATAEKWLEKSLKLEPGPNPIGHNYLAKTREKLAEQKAAAAP